MLEIFGASKTINVEFVCVMMALRKKKRGQVILHAEGGHEGGGENRGGPLGPAVPSQGVKRYRSGLLIKWSNQ